MMGVKAQEVSLSMGALERMNRADVIHVQHGNPFESMGVGLAEVREPIVIGPEDSRQQQAIRDTIHGEPLRGVEHTPGYGIRIHIHDVGMGVDPDAWDGRHTALYGELLWGLKPHTGLLIDADIAKWHAIGIPLVGFGLMDQTWGAVPERAVDALCPEVWWFNNVRIRRDERVG